MIYNLDPYLGDNPFIVWDNLLPRGTLTASSSAAGFPVTALLNGVTTDPWRPNAMPATVTLALSETAPISAVCFAAHDMGSRGVTVIFETAPASAGPWTAVATVAPDDDAPLIIAFSWRSRRYMRVRFTGDNTFRLAVMAIAEGMPIPGRIIPPHVPFHRASEVNLVGSSGGGTGNFLQADFERTGASADIRFSAQLREFAAGDAFENFRQHYNRGRPFFMAAFPSFDFLDVGYMWRGERADSITVPYQDAVFMTIGMQVDMYVG
jgi:hypothetical protein